MRTRKVFGLASRYHAKAAPSSSGEDRFLELKAEKIRSVELFGQ